MEEKEEKTQIKPDVNPEIDPDNAADKLQENETQNIAESEPDVTPEIDSDTAADTRQEDKTQNPAESELVDTHSEVPENVNMHLQNNQGPSNTTFWSIRTGCVTSESEIQDVSVEVDPEAHSIKILHTNQQPSGPQIQDVLVKSANSPSKKLLSVRFTFNNKNQEQEKNVRSTRSATASKNKNDETQKVTELKVTSHRKIYDYETNIENQLDPDNYSLEGEFDDYVEDENEDENDMYSVEEYEDLIASRLNFISYKEKGNLRQVNNFLKTVFSQHKDSCIEKYEILAVKELFFDEKDISKIERYLQCGSFLKTIKEKGDPFGFVTKVDKHNVRFSSYLNIAPYFAACFFYKNLRCAFLLKDSLNKPKYRQIKSLFQNLLDKNLKLHKLCQMGLLNEVKMLLSLKVDVNKTDENGITPLHLACVAQNREIVVLLAKYLANVNASDEDGYSPLHFACQSGNIGIIKLLLELGANPHKTTVDGLTHVDIAYKNGFRQIVNFLTNVQKKEPLSSFNQSRGPAERKNTTKNVPKKSQTFSYSQAIKQEKGHMMKRTSTSSRPQSNEDLLESAMATKLQNLNLKGQQEINILLLGETGVGKSTFINSIANYFTFSSYETAREAEELEIIVPSYVTIQTPDSDEVVVEIGSDKNECQTVGAAGTQNVRTYVFPLGETKLRLIDTPGMGDPRGIEQDDINCENVLSYLSQLKELHAICFLMRPTTTRKTVLFEYCVQQILTRLEKSASRNIVFIFTNSRGTNYTPGDTLPCIKDMIKKIKSQPPHVEIPINKKNTFSVDNESFKYLVDMKKSGIVVDEATQNRLVESWIHSANECWRLISYIVGDKTENPLNPHKLENTISINEARRMIERLSQPLADVSQLIQENITTLEIHKHHLTMDNQSLDEMKTKLYIPAIKLDVTPLNRPTTVCANAKCAELVQVDDNIKKWHYRQRCHDPCFLKNVPKEIIGDRSLVNCAAMGGRESCQICGCSYSLHMHIYYETKTFKDKIIDNVVQSNIHQKEQALNEIERIIAEMNRRKEEFEQEREVIVESCAKFAHFLQINSISPMNDSYRAYIEYLITGEEKLKGRGSREMLAQLKKLLQRYNAIRSTFETLQKHGSGATVESVLTPGSVIDTVNQLYQLKHNGVKIRELIEKQKIARR